MERISTKSIIKWEEVGNMAKGDQIKNKFMEYKDPFTGKKVTRLTTPDTLNHHPYFYYKMMTNDNRYLIYASLREGYRNLYKMDLHDGTAVQLTEGAGINDFGSILTSDDRYLIFFRDKQFIKMEMDSLKEEVFYEVPVGWYGYSPSISSDDRFLVITEMNERDMLKNKGDWSTFETQWAARPNCRIVYIDIDKKTSRTVHEEEHCWLGHPLIRPHDNNTILFCHEGPGNLIDARLWLINLDGSNLRCAKPQVEPALVTHEFWLDDGSKFAFVYREANEEQKQTIRFIDPDTQKEEVLMESSRYCHFIANKDNTLIVGDGQLPEEHFIYLVDVKEKREYKLCSHGTSWGSYGSNQDAHPHPAFSPDSQFIIFTSDREGIPSIYKVELN